MRAGSGGIEHVVPGVNAPVGKIGNTGFGMSWGNHGAANPEWFEGLYGNVFVFGAPDDLWEPFNPSLTPTEAWNIDKKLDDGLAARGRVMTFKNSSSASPACASSDTINDAEYNLSSSGKICSLNIKTGL